ALYAGRGEDPHPAAGRDPARLRQQRRLADPGLAADDEDAALGPDVAHEFADPAQLLLAADQMSGVGLDRHVHIMTPGHAGKPVAETGGRPSGVGGQAAAPTSRRAADFTLRARTDRTTEDAP